MKKIFGTFCRVRMRIPEYVPGSFLGTFVWKCIRIFDIHYVENKQNVVVNIFSLFYNRDWNFTKKYSTIQNCGCSRNWSQQYSQYNIYKSENDINVHRKLLFLTRSCIYVYRKVCFPELLYMHYNIYVHIYWDRILCTQTTLLNGTTSICIPYKSPV